MMKAAVLEQLEQMVVKEMERPVVDDDSSLIWVIELLLVRTYLAGNVFSVRLASATTVKLTMRWDINLREALRNMCFLIRQW
jgi:hypothetical protein